VETAREIAYGCELALPIANVPGNVVRFGTGGGVAGPRFAALFNQEPGEPWMNS